MDHLAVLRARIEAKSVDHVPRSRLIIVVRLLLQYLPHELGAPVGDADGVGKI